jgi:hypothetical protein
MLGWSGTVFTPENTISTTLLVRGTLLIRDRLCVGVHRSLDVGMSQHNKVLLPH